MLTENFRCASLEEQRVRVRIQFHGRLASFDKIDRDALIVGLEEGWLMVMMAMVVGDEWSERRSSGTKLPDVYFVASEVIRFQL